VAGAVKPGLFADGVINLPAAVTTGWKTYTNTTYGFSFQYPADWVVAESDSAGHLGPHGEPAYPKHWVRAENPPNEQGEKIPGVNCSQDAGDCIGAPPTLLAFAVAIWDTPCPFDGALITDNSATIAGQAGRRCVVEYPNDHTRTVGMSLRITGSDYLVVELDVGNSVSESGEAVLATMLSAFSSQNHAGTGGVAP
jgi:hypothetical protein